MGDDPGEAARPGKGTDILSGCPRPCGRYSLRLPFSGGLGWAAGELAQLKRQVVEPTLSHTPLRCLLLRVLCTRLLKFLMPSASGGYVSATRRPTSLS